MLAQIRRALKPDGLLLAAMIGGDTLTELRQSFAAAEAEIEGGVSPRVAPFADLRDVGALLQRAGFALPVTDVDRVVVRYDSAFALMQDLRAHGRDQCPGRAAAHADPPRHAAADGADLRRTFCRSDGRIRATFDIVWLSGWAPHESQQKPLKPGSAKASLEEAVKRDAISRQLQRFGRNDGATLTSRRSMNWRSDPIGGPISTRPGRSSACWSTRRPTGESTSLRQLSEACIDPRAEACYDRASHTSIMSAA